MSAAKPATLRAAMLRVTGRFDPGHTQSVADKQMPQVTAPGPERPALGAQPVLRARRQEALRVRQQAALPVLGAHPAWRVHPV